MGIKKKEGKKKHKFSKLFNFYIKQEKTSFFSDKKFFFFFFYPGYSTLCLKFSDFLCKCNKKKEIHKE